MGLPTFLTFLRVFFFSNQYELSANQVIDTTKGLSTLYVPETSSRI